MKEMLLGMKDGGIYLYKCEFIYKAVNENFEDTFRSLIKLPDRKFAIHIEVIYCILCIITIEYSLYI